MENRHGLAVNCCVTQATGPPTRGGAGDDRGDSGLAASRWVATKATTAKNWFRKCASIGSPRISRARDRIIDQRTTRHPGYALSQRKRKRVEEIFGWVKTVGGLRKTRHRGVARVDWMFSFALAAYNLVRLRNLALAPASVTQGTVPGRYGDGRMPSNRRPRTHIFPSTDGRNPQSARRK